VTAELPALAGLFLSALLAATVFPAQSEAVLLGLLYLGRSEPLVLLAVASLGNTIGAVANWALGRAANTYRGRRWFPVPEKRLASAERWFARYGPASLLLSWVPIIGDALTVAAGLLRVPIGVFVLIVGFAKTARYAVLIIAAPF
jgi:membrane protein YqaA with SNARE-associated domain